MFKISGSNIFRQWSSDDNILNNFQAVLPTTQGIEYNADEIKVLQTNWSYNIIEIDKVLYITGAWDGKEKQCIKMPLPADCTQNVCDLNVAGNDYKIVLTSKTTNLVWVLDLSLKCGFKEINLNIEEPATNVPKKKKMDYGISKIVIANDSCLYLTSGAAVYTGILPSYVDTSHCIGKVLDICCGYEHFMLLTDTGAVYTWGNGRRLQLGHGDVSNVDQPTQVEALAGIKITKICTGGWHSLVLSEFGDLYAWGWNDTGQLGINETCNSNKESLQSYGLPTLVNFREKNDEVNLNINDIACGSRHSAVLLEDYSVWTTGCNKYGQLGLSETKYPSITSFKKVYQVNRESMLICGPWTTVITEA